MGEGETGGVQIHAVGRGVAIERVAKNGTIETIGVGTMYAKLVGSACEWEEPYSVLIYEFITCDSLLALFIVHLLHGTVLKVWGEREVDRLKIEN